MSTRAEELAKILESDKPLLWCYRDQIAALLRSQAEEIKVLDRAAFLLAEDLASAWNKHDVSLWPKGVTDPDMLHEHYKQEAVHRLKREAKNTMTLTTAALATIAKLEDSEMEFRALRILTEAVE